VLSRKEETPVPKTRGEITRLLRAWHGGSDQARDELWPVLYDELRRLASSVLSGHGRGARGQATSLVHKAYLRLLGSDVAWSDRRHFFAVAARAMRFVLADEARRQLAGKRGAGEVQPLGEALPEVADPLARRPEEVLAVHQALTKLTELRPRHARLVELRYFAGLSVEETAEILEVTTRTVVRDWKAARVWLHGELGNAG
jgi:RNA polymerase sigma factor (TIGR02999 family)